MPEKEEELLPIEYQPTRINLDQYMNEVSAYDEGQPYLGLTDVITPSDDPDYENRLKRSSRMNAFGDVLGALFDTASNAAGATVEKRGPNPYQMQTLEDYNRERARVLGDQERLKQAKLQERMLSARQQIEQGRYKHGLKVQGEQQKAEREFQGEEAAKNRKIQDEYRKDNNRLREEIARQNQAGLNSRNAANIAARDRASMRSSGNKMQPYEVYDDELGESYNYSKGQIIRMYQMIANKVKKGELKGSAAQLIPFKNDYNEDDINKMYYTVNNYFKDPSINEQFVRIAEEYIPDNAIMRPDAGGRIPSLEEGKVNGTGLNAVSEGMQVFKTGNRAALAQWLKTQFPNNPAMQAQIGNQILQEIQNSKK